jgi:hypothetical protein
MARQLKPEEHALLKFLLDQSGRTDLVSELESAAVTDMADGGMGSLRFSGSGSNKMGKVLCEAESNDSDSIPLQISINLDQEGRLFELDIWKVDFSSLKTYPSTSTLKFSQPR